MYKFTPILKNTIWGGTKIAPFKNIQTNLLAFFPGIFISPEKKIYPFLPGQISRNGSISAEKMVCNDDSGISEALVKAYMFPAGADSAGAGQACMHVCLI